MININLPTGNTISITVYEWLFLLDDTNIDEFYQSCIADDLGTYIDNPFSNKIVMGKLEIDDVPDEINLES
jgi:hypothetical protein